MLSIFKVKRRRELPEFIVDVYRQNYLNEDPARFLHRKYSELNGYQVHRYNGDLMINTFRPGMSFREFKRSAGEILINEIFHYHEHRIRRVMTHDLLADIQRVSVLLFLDDRLISSRCHFPHLAAEDKNELVSLVSDKYFQGNAPENLERICLVGENKVNLYFRDFVSISFLYQLRTPEFISAVNGMVEWMDKKRLEQSLEEKSELMKKL